MAVFFLLLIVFKGERAWFVQNEIIKKYHREIVDNLTEALKLSMIPESTT